MTIDEADNRPFRPSTGALIRIISVLLEKHAVGRTDLCLETRQNNSRVKNHLQWLMEKDVVEFILENEKVRIKLTDRGIIFAKILVG